MASDAEIGRVVLVTNRFGRVSGKLAIQKIVYFFEVFGGGTNYEFKWFPLGPYSSELASDVSYLIREGSLRTDEHEPSTILAGEPSLLEYYSKVAKVDQSDENALEKCLSLLRGKSPDELELLASLHFTCQNFVRERNEESCLSVLQEHKPKFRREDAKEAWEELKRENVV